MRTPALQSGEHAPSSESLYLIRDNSAPNFIAAFYIQRSGEFNQRGLLELQDGSGLASSKPNGQMANDHTQTPASFWTPSPIQQNNDALSGLLLEDALLHNAEHKLANSIDKTFFLGLLGGLWMAMGGIAASSASGGITASIREAWPMLPKLGVALFFPFSMVRLAAVL